MLYQGDGFRPIAALYDHFPCSIQFLLFVRFFFLSGICLYFLHSFHKWHVEPFVFFLFMVLVGGLHVSIVYIYIYTYITVNPITIATIPLRMWLSMDKTDDQKNHIYSSDVFVTALRTNLTNLSWLKEDGVLALKLKQCVVYIAHNQLTIVFSQKMEVEKLPYVIRKMLVLPVNKSWMSCPHLR